MGDVANPDLLKMIDEYNQKIAKWSDYCKKNQTKKPCNMISRNKSYVYPVNQNPGSSKKPSQIFSSLLSKKK